MASYGIPSAGKTLSASVNSDTIKLALGQTAEASSTDVYGLAGNDVISYAALGATETASANGGVTLTLVTGVSGASADVFCNHVLWCTCGAIDLRLLCIH